MQLLSCHDGKLLKVDSADLGGASAVRSFSTRLNAVDRLLPGGGLGRGVIHEVLWAGKGARPFFLAAGSGCSCDRAERDRSIMPRRRGGWSSRRGGNEPCNAGRSN